MKFLRQIIDMDFVPVFHCIMTVYGKHGGACNKLVYYLRKMAKLMDVLPYDLGKSRSGEIGCCNNRIALKFDRHLGSTVVDVPFKFQSAWKV